MTMGVQPKQSQLIILFLKLLLSSKYLNNLILTPTPFLHTTIKQNFLASAMSSTRRSRRVIPRNPIVSSRKKPCYSTPNSQLEGYNGVLTIAENSKDLLAQCFLSMRSAIWYRILPKNDERDSISDGFGQKWEYVLPLLCNSGLIKSKIEDSSLLYSVLRYQWEDFCKLFSNDRGRRLHFAVYREMRKKEEWFIRINEPQ